MYLTIDVLSLRDVFEKFISVCLRDYGLDLARYISSPSLSWNAMLKFTGIKFEKIYNISVHLVLEKGIRGRFFYISKRYSKSNESTNSMYLDTNNWYGWTMVQNLPYGCFKFLSREEIDVFDLDSIPENRLVGYLLEVDLEYCKKLHDSHRDYPVCPEKTKVTSDMLSKYCGDIADWYNIKYWWC